MRRIRLLALFALTLWGACTCQRAENVAAKERLTKPQPKELSSAKAQEKIPVDDLADREKLARVVKMDGSEVASRLGSFSYTSSGEFSFGREGGAGIKAAENTTLVQSDNGDFSIDVVTGDGSEQRLAYVNEIFFLKNGNGAWRISRDPSGERNTYRSDALAVWASFYELVGHALVVERTGATTYQGRGAIGYRIGLPDETAQAVAAGAGVTDGPLPPVTVPGVDGAPDTTVEAPEDEDVHRKRIAGRVTKWAERSKPAGGKGAFVVDEATGVLLKIDFDGALVVGDGKVPAKMTVKLNAAMKDIGKAQTVRAPQDAINEIVRKKMPVGPRAIFEEAGVVQPLPEEEGKPKSTKKKKKIVAVDPPDDD